MVVAASGYGDAFQWQGLGDWKIIDENLLETTLNCGKNLLSNRTVTTIIQPR
jgi:hypothetical protein